MFYKKLYSPYLYITLGIIYSKSFKMGKREDYECINSLTSYEPKQSNRWKVVLPENFNIQEWQISHVTPLKFSLNEETNRYGWEDTVISIRDIVSPNPSQKLSNLIESRKFHNFDFKVIMLGPVGDEVEVRTYEGCNIKEIDFGRTDYENGSTNIIKITIKNKKVIIY